MTQPHDPAEPQQWPPPAASQPWPGPHVPSGPTADYQAPAPAGPPVWPAPPTYPGAAPYPPGGFPTAARPYKDGTVAWLLWLFLGFFGAHHFYLGNTGRGVAYAVGWVVSLITTALLIGVLGLLALLVLWIIDAAQMTSRLQQVNAQIFAMNRAAGLI